MSSRKSPVFGRWSRPGQSSRDFLAIARGQCEFADMGAMTAGGAGLRGQKGKSMSQKMRLTMLHAAFGAWAMSAQPCQAAPFTHADRCKFFSTAALTLIQLRDKGRTQNYSMTIVAAILSLEKFGPNFGEGVAAGFEKMGALGIGNELSAMATELWDEGPMLGEGAIIQAQRQCGWKSPYQPPP
jgi:hypothetical protein